MLVANADEVTCWNEGCRLAIGILRDSGVFPEGQLDVDDILRREPGVDMLRPYREQI